MDVPQEELAVVRLHSYAAFLCLEIAMSHLREADGAPNPAQSILGARVGLRDALRCGEQIDVTLDKLGVSRVSDLEPARQAIPAALMGSPNNRRLYNALQQALSAAVFVEEERGYTDDESPVVHALGRLMTLVTAELNSATEPTPSDNAEGETPNDAPAA